MDVFSIPGNSYSRFFLPGCFYRFPSWANPSGEQPGVRQRGGM